jgi:hypothetical protein
MLRASLIAASPIEHDLRLYVRELTQDLESKCRREIHLLDLVAAQQQKIEQLREQLREYMVKA